MNPLELCRSCLSTSKHSKIAVVMWSQKTTSLSWLNGLHDYWMLHKRLLLLFTKHKWMSQYCLCVCKLTCHDCVSVCRLRPALLIWVQHIHFLLQCLFLSCFPSLLVCTYANIFIISHSHIPAHKYTLALIVEGLSHTHLGSVVLNCSDITERPQAENWQSLSYHFHTHKNTRTHISTHTRTHTWTHTRAQALSPSSSSHCAAHIYRVFWKSLLHFQM